MAHSHFRLHFDCLKNVFNVRKDLSGGYTRRGIYPPLFTDPERGIVVLVFTKSAG